MSSVVSVRMLVKTSVKDNNNKFWEATLFSNDDVLCRWGRVGANGQSKTFAGAGQKYVDKKIREKNKKGYKEMQVAGGASSASVKKVAGNALRAVAKKQIAGSSTSSVVTGLVDYLVDVNRHDIKTASGGRLQVDVSSGLIETDVGVAVTLDTLDRARTHLVALSGCITAGDYASNKFIENLNDYLMAVPQKVGSRRGWEKAFLRGQSDIQRQSALIDSMESTLKAFTPAAVTAKDVPEEEVFNLDLKLITDGRTTGRIDKKFASSLDRSHQSARHRIKNVYKVDIRAMAAAFERDGKKLGNIKELWHGTSSANLLSILKCGLVVPPANAGHCTGRMWGNGVYTASSSTKALNYSTGFWGQAGTRRTFMFLVDVGLGKTYTPRSGTSWGYKLPRGYDSTWAKRRESGLRHDEFITPRTAQCNLTYLIEFAR